MEAELDAGGIRVGAKYRYRQKDQAATLTRMPPASSSASMRSAGALQIQSLAEMCIRDRYPVI